MPLLNHTFFKHIFWPIWITVCIFRTSLYYVSTRFQTRQSLCDRIYPTLFFNVFRVNSFSGPVLGLPTCNNIKNPLRQQCKGLTFSFLYITSNSSIASTDSTLQVRFACLPPSLGGTNSSTTGVDTRLILFSLEPMWFFAKQTYVPKSDAWISFILSMCTFPSFNKTRFSERITLCLSFCQMTDAAGCACTVQRRSTDKLSALFTRIFSAVITGLSARNTGLY